MAPGPFLSTTLAAVLLSSLDSALPPGTGAETVQRAFLPGLVSFQQPDVIAHGKKQDVGELCSEHQPGRSGKHAIDAELEPSRRPAHPTHSTQPTNSDGPHHGFTWEHDAHLYLRRANALLALWPVDRAREDVTRLMSRGVKTRTRIELPPEAEAIRMEVWRFVDEYKTPPDDHSAGAGADGAGVHTHATPFFFSRRSAGHSLMMLLQQCSFGVAK